MLRTILVLWFNLLLAHLAPAIIRYVDMAATGTADEVGKRGQTQKVNIRQYAVMTKSWKLINEKKVNVLRLTPFHVPSSPLNLSDKFNALQNSSFVV